MKIELKHCLESRDYLFWTPGPGQTVEVGAERKEFSLPQIPLPIHRADLQDSEPPATDAVGNGLYDFLRQFPDTPHGRLYAEILRDAFPHYLADLGAQIVMIEHKEVDAPYVRRKIAAMQILALLEPDNPGLLEKLGAACFDLGMMFAEFINSRTLLLKAMGYLQRSLNRRPENPACLNYLGQIDYLLGDYPSAARRWNGVMQMVTQGPVREALRAKIARIERGEVPGHPLLDDLEAIGEAMTHYGRGEYHEAASIMEILEEKNIVTTEFPSPEIFHLLGMCRAKNNDTAGAFEAFEKALAIDPNYAPARQGREAILEGRDI